MLGRPTRRQFRRYLEQLRESDDRIHRAALAMFERLGEERGYRVWCFARARRRALEAAEEARADLLLAVAERTGQDLERVLEVAVEAAERHLERGAEPEEDDPGLVPTVINGYPVRRNARTVSVRG